MTRVTTVAAAATAVLSLAACHSNAGRGAAASGVCKPFANAGATNALPNPPGADPSAAVDDCLHRWGYTLAAAADPANVVAQATVAACGPSITTWNRTSVATGGQPVEAPSIVSGQPTNPIAEHFNFAMGRALLYVVQARAGHCEPPPASAQGGVSKR